MDTLLPAHCGTEGAFEELFSTEILFHIFHSKNWTLSYAVVDEDSEFSAMIKFSNRNNIWIPQF